MTPNAAANRRAKNSSFITFAIVLQTPRTFTVTALGMSAFLISRFVLSNLRMERVWISLQTQSDGESSLVFVVEVVVTLKAVAVGAEFTVCEAITVELEALRFGAVAWFL